MNESISEKIFNIFNVLFLTFLALIMLYPMIYVLFASLSNPFEYASHIGPLFKPLGFYLKAYQLVIQDPSIISGYMNTIFIIVFGVTLNILLTSIGAYFLSRKNVLFQPVISMMIIFTMFFSGGLIPFYFIVKGIHLDNTLFAVTIPVAINTFNLIILRTAFSALPDSIEESARIDGAGHFTILFKIIIPLSMPTIAVMILYYGVYHWNAWFNAMIFLQKRELFPLQLILREKLIVSDLTSMVSNAASGEELLIGEIVKYAVIIVATVPILALYPFLQKYFVKGVLIGGVKE
jgi:putative aldouronate transport system permease protein